jgi:hypothetical protein
MRIVKDDRTTTWIWALAALVAVGVLVVIVVIARQQDDDSSTLSNDQIEALREILGAGPDETFDEGFVDRRLAEIGEPLGGRPFDSFEAAEIEAGFHIPRASSEFVLADGLTYLERFWQPPGETAPVSRSKYVSAAGEDLTFEVVPATYDTTDSRSEGVPTTFGSKDGWMLDSDSGDYFFAWTCGFADSGTELYCTVLADGDVDEATVEAFVASLR